MALEFGSAEMSAFLEAYSELILDVQNKRHYARGIREIAPQVDQMQFVGLDETCAGIADAQPKKLVIGRLARLKLCHSTRT
jgi:hypothetical protein